jgi:putative iron-only hydrogenase system regulator
MTETRVAILAVVVSDNNSVEELNHILHDYSQYIIGRMGIPYNAKGINLISVAVDAPLDTISSLAGKIGKLQGVTAKAAYSNVATVIEDNV